jgi:hypothetical protein
MGHTPLVIPQRYGPLGQDAFAVTAWVNDRFYMSVLRGETPGHLGAVMRLPLYGEMPSTTLQVIQLWTRDDRPPLAEVAAYDLALDELLGEAVPEVLLSVERKAKPRKARAPRLIREGYALTVRTDVRRDHAFLLFEMVVGDAEAPGGGSERLVRITRDWRDFGLRSPAPPPAPPPADGLVHPELVEWGVTR